MEKLNNKQLLISIGILVLVAAISVGLTLLAVNSPSGEELNEKQAKSNASEFINNNLMTGDKTANIESIAEEYGLYKMDVNIGQGQNITSYLSKDGKLLFPQAITMKDIKKDTAKKDQGGNKTPDRDIPTREKPKVELFAMSHCPYGTQTEKGMLPVVEKLGDKIDFEVQFVDYAMHGEKELKEQLNQYCIQENYPDKYTDYLRCYLDTEKENGDTCMDELNINQEEIASCADTQDEKYSVMENFRNDQEYKGSYPTFKLDQEANKKYGIGGSPGLAINETKVSSFSRDPQSLLDTVCQGFENKPEECDAELSSSAPSPGFGFNQGGNQAASAASCN